MGVWWRYNQLWADPIWWIHQNYNSMWGSEPLTNAFWRPLFEGCRAPCRRNCFWSNQFYQLQKSSKIDLDVKRGPINSSNRSKEGRKSPSQATSCITYAPKNHLIVDYPWFVDDSRASTSSLGQVRSPRCFPRCLMVSFPPWAHLGVPNWGLPQNGDLYFINLGENDHQQWECSGTLWYLT